MGQFGDYGHTPSKSSFFLHASVANHYFEGGWFPRGGSGEIAKQIIPVIEKAGGRVLVGKSVTNILIKKGKACGVSVKTGTELVDIYAPIIISACGVINTYKKLIPSEIIPKGIIEKIDKLGPSGTMIYLFVGMKGSPESLELRSSNIWHLPTETGDYDEMLEKFYNDPGNAHIPFIYWISLRQR